MQSLTKCLSEVKGWLAANFLLLNDCKTEAVIVNAKSPGPVHNYPAPPFGLNAKEPGSLDGFSP